MSRVALVAPRQRLRAMLVVVAEAGCVEFAGPLAAAVGEAVEALRRLERAGSGEAAAAPRIARERPELAQLEKRRRRDLLAGEVELERQAASSLRCGEFAAYVGWCPAGEVAGLSQRLGEAGAAIVALPRPPLVEPPTLLRTRAAARPFRPLIDTYGATRYADVDPTPFAAASFTVMFGMMFGDVGHGLLLAALGLLLRRSRGPRWAPIRPLWPFAVAGGLAAAVAGLLYGEAFGPTGLPALWLAPLDQPVTLLGAALGLGAGLLAVSYALGVANRWREGGPGAALLAPSGIAGLAVFAAAALLGAGVAAGVRALVAVGAAIAAIGVLLLFAGSLAGSEAPETPGSAVARAAIEVIDGVIRVGANVISFTRLAAFGLMHAALGSLVLAGARSLWAGGVVVDAAGGVLFLAGTVAAFALEVLVAGVQAMRLEYYELFSRLFAGQGEPFRPWTMPVVEYGSKT